MGERLLCKQEVIGSIPFTSTTGAVGCADDRLGKAKLRATVATLQATMFGEEQERYRFRGVV